MVYWQYVNLISSPTVFYSPIENGLARVALQAVVFLDFGLKNMIMLIVGFRLQSVQFLLKQLNFSPSFSMICASLTIR